MAEMIVDLSKITVPDGPAPGAPSGVELKVAEALVIRPGDHLIVRVETDLGMEDMTEIKRLLKERFPLLQNVTVIRADGLYVFRDEVAHG